MEEYVKYWKNYVNFSGRSTRKEYWLPVLFNIVISGILSAINAKLGTIFGLVTLIPNIAIDIRRMHDINKSGWNLFLGLIPIVGWIILLVYACTPSVNEGNVYPVDAEDINVADDVVVDNASDADDINNDNSEE